MRLTAFRIRNFRSIKDTGWNELANDNITCLIGQNESGKTSILEGLKAFYDGILIEDMLRSDLSMPVISCRYSYSFDTFSKTIPQDKLLPEVRKKLAGLDYISLKRCWENEYTSYITTGEELDEIFEKENQSQIDREIKVLQNLEDISKKFQKASTALEKAKEDYEQLVQKLNEKTEELLGLKKEAKGIFRIGKKNSDPEHYQALENSIREIEEEKNKKSALYSQRKNDVQQVQEKMALKEKITAAEVEIMTRKKELLEKRDELQQFSSIADLKTAYKEIRAAEAKEEHLGIELELAEENLENAELEYYLLVETTEKVLEGVSYEDAIESVRETHEQLQKYMTPKELGEEIFKLTPDFEMFEDFSSLLPNRIDLEDIVLKNNNVEGYKAAINFLTITGLDYSFFQQPSSRILKQKIETLNGELTLNFQDFWRQNVGKKNKIKINFELGHYDHSHEIKSGKPYIEFWIKDESERLYPKQRSRGVRWFLSFFLELKATAMDKTNQNKLLLIDEPGVSLHARAQEDVLKVFEDIKEKIQIIYSTHSPHLIDVNKLYRVLAVQRAVEDDMNSETVVLNTRSLKVATADTLTPVYAMMGTRLSQQDIIKSYNNVIVRDLASYYFLKSVMLLTNYTDKECYFLPASGTSSMPMIINILIGWGLEYITLTFGNEEDIYMHNKLRKELFDNNVDLAKKQLLHIREFSDVEDVFSTIDFKRHVIHVREGITTKNSEYLKDNNHSRAFIASSFLQQIVDGHLSIKDFDEETVGNLSNLINQISLLLK